MALQLILGTLIDGKYVANFDVDGTKAYVSDSTGDYDATNNPGGYGAPNPVRSDVAWINVVQYMGLDETENIVIEAYNPLSAAQITIPITKDGHIQVNGFLIPVIVGGEADGSYGYDTADSKVKLLISGTWVEVTDLTTLLTASGLTSDVIHIPVLIASSRKLNDINKERFDAIISGEYDEGRLANDRLYNNMKGRISQASNNFCAGNYYEFQRIVEATKIFVAANGI